MNTFEDVVEMFLNTVREIDYINYTEEELFEELGIKVKMVIAKARVFKELSFDKSKSEFSRTVTDMEATILALGLVVEWLSPRVYNYELLESQLSSKDFTIFSNANRLSELRALRDDSRIEFHNLLADYDFDITEFEV